VSDRTVQTVVGMEVHVQLKTRTKLFCSCETRFGDVPNSHVCPVCLGMPGVLPVMNREAYRLAVMTALALGCRLAERTKWDRKHYYYPDLPKNFQISQYDMPLGEHGHLEIETPDGDRKKIRILRVHLEEDAGKLTHAEGGGNASEVDLNRTGTPLMEIVSQPDLRSVDEVRAYCTGLRQLVTYLGVSEANMQMGHMRFEPNINLRITEDGGTAATPIVELKNLNSFRAVERAVAFEERRQLDEWDEGRLTLEQAGKVTRGWNDDTGETFVQRQKEEAHDYRYFPEPDLVVVEPEVEWIEGIRAELPELPLAKKDRFVRDFGLSDYDAGVLTAHIEMARYYERVAELSDAPKAAANWVTQGLLREINARGETFYREAVAITKREYDKAEDAIADVAEVMGPQFMQLAPHLVVSAEKLAELVSAVEAGTVNKQAGDKVLKGMIETGRPAAEIIEAEGLAQTSDTAELEKWIEEAIAANPGPAADVRAGKKKALGRIMGHIMKASRGKANPRVVTELLEKKLAP